MLEIAGGILIAVAALFALLMLMAAAPDFMEKVLACLMVAGMAAFFIALVSIPVAITYAFAPEWGPISIVGVVALTIQGICSSDR